ncbi:MAG: UvrD-helicase domain-containing protein, partial [Lapillicoccus sp.]
MSRVVLLRRAPALVVDAPRLDAEQRGVLDLRAPLVRVLGAPGTGKTTTAVELVVDRVVRGGLAPDECLLLTSTRVAAARLRERVTTRLARTSTEALARTHQAFGFGLLRQAAALRGDETPRLISGPEQDVVLRELLAGHERGDAPRPPWPAHLEPALDKRGFRSELRDLLMRAVEHGIEADALAELGREHGRPEWVAAAQVLTEYDEVTAFSRPGAYDPAWILTAAADLLEDDEQARARMAAEVRLVVVDDAQELTSAAARLLRAVTGAGADLVLL